MGGASYLPWYALGMTLLGGVAVLIATHQSRGRPGFLAVLLPLAILEPVLLMRLHQTLVQVVQVVDVSMGLILLAMGAFYVTAVRSRGSMARSEASLRDMPEHQIVRSVVNE